MTSQLLNYLPEIYRSADSNRQPFNLGEFLLAFDRVLLGYAGGEICYKDGIIDPTAAEKDVCYEGLEQTIAKLSTYFDANETPTEFLEWLAGWAALSLRADLDEAKQRKFIGSIVGRYQYRGTKKNLQDLLEIFLTVKPAIANLEEPYQFRVTLQLPAQPETLARQLDIAVNIIELEKPAHTAYELDFRFPTMRIGDPNYPRRQGSRLGIDTLLGTIPDQEPPLIELPDA